MDTLRAASFSIRIGLAIAFLYAAIASFLNPVAWSTFLPPFITSIFPAQPLLFLFAAFEIILALWLLSNKKIYYAAIISSLVLVAIIVANLEALDLIFRDVAILASALALILLSTPAPASVPTSFNHKTSQRKK